jgi:hypothetical protein
VQEEVPEGKEAKEVHQEGKGAGVAGARTAKLKPSSR